MATGAAPRLSLIPQTCYFLGSAEFVERTLHHMGWGLVSVSVWYYTICCIKAPNTDEELGCRQLVTPGGNMSFAPLKSGGLKCQVASCFIFSEHVEEAEGPGESFYWTLIRHVKLMAQLGCDRLLTAFLLVVFVVDCSFWPIHWFALLQDLDEKISTILIFVRWAGRLLISINEA